MKNLGLRLNIFSWIYTYKALSGVGLKFYPDLKAHDCCCSLTKSCPTLWPYELQHSRLPCPSPTPRAYSNSCSLSQWCHPTISSSVISCSSCLHFFSSIRVFSNESTLRMRWPKYWSFSFSISPSNEYSGLISFRIDWLDLLAVQGTLKSLLQHHGSKVSILQHSALFIVTPTYHKNSYYIFLLFPTST